MSGDCAARDHLPPSGGCPRPPAACNWSGRRAAPLFRRCTMTGPVEEAGKLAGGVVEALKTQPLGLIMLIVNVLLIGLLFYVAVVSSRTREREVTQIYAAQKEVQQLLARCFTPTANQSFRLQSDETKPA